MQDNNGFVFYDPYEQPPEPPKKKKKESKPIVMTRKKLFSFALVVILLAGSLSFGGTYLANHLTGGSGDNPSTSADSTGFDLQDATGSKLSVQEVADKAGDSVVEIRTESVSSDAWVREYVTEGAGSGVIIKSNGYILTNNHVIEGASSITVTLANGKEYSAETVGTDSANDVAVLKINAKNLTAATLGNSDQMEVGDMAVIIGNPLGTLGGSVSAGIVSSLNREITLDDTVMNLIQTDASVNPGNSGGGMFNEYGQLVGIVVAKSSGTDVEGLGFAIPINVAAASATEIMENGSIDSNTDAPQEQYSEEGYFFNDGNDSLFDSIWPFFNP